MEGGCSAEKVAAEVVMVLSAGLRCRHTIVCQSNGVHTAQRAGEGDKGSCLRVGHWSGLLGSRCKAAYVWGGGCGGGGRPDRGGGDATGGGL